MPRRDRGRRYLVLHRGLGRAAAERFHERGAAVAVNVRNRHHPDRAVPRDLPSPKRGFSFVQAGRAMTSGTAQIE